MVIQNLLKRNRTFFALLVIFTISIMLFYPSLNYFFFQDDWFVLKWISFEPIISFFKFRQDTIYWRPLSMPILFFSLYKIFGLNPLAFHLINYFLFILLIFSVYLLFNNFLNKKLSLFATFFYSTWPIHFMSLSWLSTTSYILFTLFLALSFNFFIKFTKIKNSWLYLLSFLSFILAITSNELSLIFPLILTVYILYEKSYKNLYLLIPFFAATLIFLIFRFWIYPVNATGSYKPIFNYLIIDNFIWYMMRAFNFPESFKELIDQSQIFESIKTLAVYWKTSIPVVFTSIVLAANIVVFLFKKPRFLIFTFAWTIIGLLPVIALVNHSYVVYLSFAGLGLISLIVKSFEQASKKSLLILLVLWFFSSYSSLEFTKNSHWLVNEEKISRSYVELAKNIAPAPKKRSTFLIKPASNYFANDHGFYLSKGKQMIEQALSNEAAIQVVYNDPSLRSFFVDDLESITLPNTKVYDLEAR